MVRRALALQGNRPQGYEVRLATMMMLRLVNSSSLKPGRLAAISGVRRSWPSMNSVRHSSIVRPGVFERRAIVALAQAIQKHWAFQCGSRRCCQGRTSPRSVRPGTIHGRSWPPDSDGNRWISM